MNDINSLSARRPDPGGSMIRVYVLIATLDAPTRGAQPIVGNGCAW